MDTMAALALATDPPEPELLDRRRMSLTELSEAVDITLANLSILKTGKARAIRFSTLEAICTTLHCQPGDILVFEDEAED